MLDPPKMALFRWDPAKNHSASWLHVQLPSRDGWRTVMYLTAFPFLRYTCIFDSYTQKNLCLARHSL